MNNTLCLVCSQPGKALSFAPVFEGYVRCCECGLLINHPFPSQNEIEEYYKDKARSGNYELLPQHDEMRKEGYRDVLRQLVKATGINLKNASILDIGCLNGVSLEVIAELDAVPYGIELQEGAGSVAAEKFPNRVIVGDVCKSTLFDRDFSVIIMKDVVEHLSVPKSVLASLHRQLAKNGYLLLTTPDVNSLISRILRGNWPSLSPVHHVYLFNRGNITTLLRACGFEVVATKPLWKRVSLEYVKWIMPNFNPRLARLLHLIPGFLCKHSLPLNGGEMVVIARKSN